MSHTFKRRHWDGKSRDPGARRKAARRFARRHGVTPNQLRQLLADLAHAPPSEPALEVAPCE